MNRSEAANYWADTAVSYFQTMAPGQKPPTTPVEQVTARRRQELPSPDQSPSSGPMQMSVEHKVVLPPS